LTPIFAASNFTPVADQVTLTTLVIPTTITVNLLLANSTTGSGNARIVIYSADSNTKLPRTLYFSSESLSLASPLGGGFIATTSSTTITPGAYWIGTHTSGSAGTLFGGTTPINSSFWGYTTSAITSVTGSGLRATVGGQTYASGAPNPIGVPTINLGVNSPAIFAKFISSP
jgi:hypothetical protein